MTLQTLLRDSLGCKLLLYPGQVMWVWVAKPATKNYTSDSGHLMQLWVAKPPTSNTSDTGQIMWVWVAKPATKNYKSDSGHIMQVWVAKPTHQIQDR